MKLLLVGLLLLAPAAESKSAKAQCKDRCSINYSLCLKRTTTKKGRSQCQAERSRCKGTCSASRPAISAVGR